VNPFPVHPSASVAKVNQFPLHPLASAAKVNQLPLSILSLNYLPGAFTGTEPTADPKCHTPAPPARYFCIVEIGVSFQSGLETLLLADKPSMSGVQVALVNWPIGIFGHGLRGILDGPPEITDHPVYVVDGFSSLER
jgi:hypothetical protein